MMMLITGGSGSGKSVYAEKYTALLAGDGGKYYIATMRAGDKESLKKIERHRRMRRGKGFETIEQPVDIDRALSAIRECTGECGELAEKIRKSVGGREEAPGKNRESAGEMEDTALLECLSNLTANEMFAGETPIPPETAAEKILRDIERLRSGLKHLVIVTNNVFEDGIRYDDTTMDYLKALGYINRSLAAAADQVTEVVAGIPLVIKGEK